MGTEILLFRLAPNEIVRAWVGLLRADRLPRRCVQVGEGDVGAPLEEARPGDVHRITVERP